MLVATNAPYGLNITSIGNSFTSGNNVIPALASPSSSSIGSSQFGLNLRDNSSPDIGEEPAGIGAASVNPQYNAPNLYKFVNGEAVASSTGTSDFKKFTVSYIVNVSQDQKPGIYSTTLLYNCLANF
jgi:hypothetical protein